MRQTELHGRPLRGKSAARGHWACRLTHRSAMQQTPLSPLTAENLMGSQSQKVASSVPLAGVQGRFVRTNSTFEARLSPSREPRGFRP
jgi:hypothetical protein